MGQTVVPLVSLWGTRSRKCWSSIFYTFKWPSGATRRSRRSISWCRGLNRINGEMLCIEWAPMPDRSVAVPVWPRCQFRFHGDGQLQPDAPASHDIKLRFLRGKLPYELLPSMPCCCALRLIETCVVVVVVVVLMAGPQRKSWPGRDSWWTLRRRTASRHCIWPPSTTTATWPRSSSKRWGEVLWKVQCWNLALSHVFFVWMKAENTLCTYVDKSVTTHNIIEVIWLIFIRMYIG